ncbi:hypothetical protein ACHAXS_005612 [Conticribra weissflogii]
MTPLDYSKFGGFFDKVIRDYHGDESGDKKHITDWNVDDAEDYDVKKLGQDELSMRITGPTPTSFPKRSINSWWMLMSCLRTWMPIRTSRVLESRATGRMAVGVGSRRTKCVSFGLEKRISYASCV